MTDPVNTLAKHVAPDRRMFDADPFGYAGFAWARWAVVQNLAGFKTDPEKPPTTLDLKSPVLWLSQARARSEAATVVLVHRPTYESHPRALTGVCDSQYCAVGLMLVAFSVEVCLKAMLIIRHGVGGYSGTTPV